MSDALESPMDLAEWRNRLRAARRALSVQDRLTADAWLCTQLYAGIVARDAAQVLGYWPQGTEPDLRPLLCALLAQGLRVGLPGVTRRDPCAMAFRAWHGTQAELRPDVWGIPAPARDADILAPDPHTVVLVPGLGFTDTGLRLGAGAGCYDRWLAPHRAAASRPWLIGVAYACQRLDELPLRPWDVPMDAVIFAPESSS